jgi:hypothetical protein
MVDAWDAFLTRLYFCCSNAFCNSRRR